MKPLQYRVQVLHLMNDYENMHVMPMQICTTTPQHICYTVMFKNCKLHQKLHLFTATTFLKNINVNTNK